MNNNRCLYSMLIFLLTIALACSSKQKTEEQIDLIENTASYYKDSISTINRRKIRIFGSDSICEFYKDTTSLFGVKYLDSNAIIVEKYYYKDGSLSLITYNWNRSPNSIKDESFYPEENKLETQRFCVDTTIITDGNAKICHELYIKYHKNAAIEYIGYYGHDQGQINAVGIHKSFNKFGQLMKTENYMYPIDDRPYIVISEYYENGVPRWEKKYINSNINENDNEEFIGLWKYYDETGKLIKTEKH